MTHPHFTGRDRRDKPAKGDPPALRAALALLRAGFRPVPIYPGKKKPIGQRWGLKRHTEETLREEWRRHPGAGLGILLGDDGSGRGVIDFEVDDEALAAEVIARVFPSGLPDTLRFAANAGMHYLLLYSPLLAGYGQTIIKGWVEDGEIKGNPYYLGVEFRIGTIDPARPVQEQSVIPPTPRDDGTPRQWIGPGGVLLLPEAAFDSLDRILPIPEEVFADLDAHARPEPEKSYVLHWDAEEVKRAALPHALALAKEWGLEITGNRPTAKGFWECRAIDRKDNDPSAGFHEATGVYTDRKHGTDLSLFQLAVALRAFPDFCSAVDGLGKRYGLTPRRFAKGQGAKEAEEANKGVGASFASSASFAAGGPQRNGASFASSASFAGAHPSEEEDVPVVIRPWPVPPGEAAWVGPAGEFVGMIAAHTESDPVALLVQFLIAFGSVIGRTAYFEVEADRHYANLFGCLVGQSAKARKGTSWGQVRRVFARVDEEWAIRRVLSGLSSGEGLIWNVRDPVTKREPLKDKGRVIDYQEVVTDPGVDDKRILCLEPELAGPLQAISREGNTLSAVIRRAWDDGNLRTLTKNTPNVSTGAHVSIIGHVTRDEVSRLLNETEAANGFGNRFLWACVRRSRSLPFGGMADRLDFDPLCDRLTHAVAVARSRGRVRRDGGADRLWLEVYGGLSEGKPGLLGAILGRAEAQTMRLALIYALLDGSPAIERRHLEAALALWRYCEDSARYIFGESLGDTDADHLYDVLCRTPEGLSQSQISVLVFQKHKSKKEIASILGRLQEHGRVESEKVETEGRPRKVWHARGRPSEPADEDKRAAKEAEEANKARGSVLTWLVGFLTFRSASVARIVEEASREGFDRADLEAAAAALSIERFRDESGAECWKVGTF